MAHYLNITRLQGPLVDDICSYLISPSSIGFLSSSLGHYEMLKERFYYGSPTTIDSDSEYSHCIVTMQEQN